MNWGFWFMIGTLLGLVLCILYSALVVASRSDEKEQNMPVDENVYLCGGNPECFGKYGCGLCGKGYCFCTTHIQFARNRFSLLNGKSESNYRLAKWAKPPHIGNYCVEHSKLKEQEHE